MAYTEPDFDEDQIEPLSENGRKKSTPLERRYWQAFAASGKYADPTGIPEAMELLQSAIAYSREDHGASMDPSEAEDYKNDALARLGFLALAGGDEAYALRCFRESHRSTQVLRQDPDYIDAYALWPRTILGLSLCACRADDPVEGKRQYAEALQLFQAFAALKNTDPDAVDLPGTAEILFGPAALFDFGTAPEDAQKLLGAYTILYQGMDFEQKTAEIMSAYTDLLISVNGKILQTLSEKDPSLLKTDVHGQELLSTVIAQLKTAFLELYRLSGYRSLQSDRESMTECRMYQAKADALWKNIQKDNGQ